MLNVGYNDIKISFEKEGYKLTTKESEYVNTKNPNKLSFICPNGHEHSMRWSGWIQGWRCVYCSRMKNKQPYNEFVDLFEKEGYKLIYPSKKDYYKFKVKSEKVILICPEGHTHKTLRNNFVKGSRCLECFKIRKRIGYSEIIDSFSKRGYEILYPLKNEYKAAYKDKIKYKCPNGHIHYIMYQEFKAGHGCPHCVGLAKLEFKNVIEPMIKEGYKIITKESEYKNSKSYIDFICPNGHEHKIKINDWRNGVRCGKCDNSKWSKEEKEIAEYISSLGVEMIENDRNLISPLELDMVIPDKKIAIEYCGLYWHGEKNGKKDKNYHLNKLLKCNEIGYRLITIFEDEWLNKKDIVKNVLKNKIGLTTKSLYARKCGVCEIEAKRAKKFIDNNHLQGYTGSSIKLGLFYKGELVSMMTFAKPSVSKGIKNSKGTIWEISRFCSSKRIVGGAGKLLSYFKKNYNYDGIFTFADRRWSDGNLYEKIGFTFDSMTKPNYWYVKNNEIKRLHRFNFRKDKIKHLGKGTEWDIMRSVGYDRIWDCGNIKYKMVK